jgi:hypothetical protein
MTTIPSSRDKAAAYWHSVVGLVSQATRGHRDPVKVVMYTFSEKE